MTELQNRLSADSLFYPTCRLGGRVGGQDYSDRRAMAVGESLSLRLEIPRRCGVSSAELRIRNETAGSELRSPLSWCAALGAYDVYEGRVKGEEIGVGLCFFDFSFQTPIGLAHSERISPDAFRLTAGECSSSYQLLVSEFRYPAPERQYGGIVYQIFVDRFHRGKSEPIPDGMELVGNWEELRLEYPAYPGAPMKNNIVYGGNLDGIRRKLPYLASLGVSLLYLTPIFRSPSNHKYDTADYTEIDPLFGDEQDLVWLIREAREYGIGILLDGVFNHTGSDSIYFNRKGTYPTLGAAQSPESPYFSWYRFRHYPDSYECWWDIDILPRIHPEEPSCAEYFIGEGGVIDRYASLGIAGMRLDVADELPDFFIEGIKRRLSLANPESLLYGEVWEDASNKIAYDVRKRYFHGGELDGVMNYPLRTAILRYVREGDTEPMRFYLGEVMPNTPERILHAQMNLIGTHDTVRAITALAGEDAQGKSTAELFEMRMSPKEYRLGIARMKQAAVILYTMPGLPMLYYGDEAGMQGYSDPFNRLPYPWGRECDELLSFFSELGIWRRHSSALRRGAFRLIRLDSEVMLLERTDSTEHAFAAVNRGSITFEHNEKRKISTLIGGRNKNGKIFVEADGFAVWTVSEG